MVAAGEDACTESLRSMCSAPGTRGLRCYSGRSPGPAGMFRRAAAATVALTPPAAAAVQHRPLAHARWRLWDIVSVRERGARVRSCDSGFRHSR